MGPYPHDAPPATISDDNPMGTDGFEFVEYASTEPEKLCRLFETLGFAAIARHRSKDVTLYRQGDVNFVVNAEPDSFARRFAEMHGPCACAMAFRVVDAKHAFERALSDHARGGSLRAIALRYFNAAGCDPGGARGEDHRPVEEHLVPLAVDAALGHRAAFTIHGADYDTPDGTCVRDFIHVSDLARAHVLALAALDRGDEFQAVNLGSETGHSVRQVVEAEVVTGRGPQAFVADPSRGFGYVAHFSDSYVGVVDLNQQRSTYGTVVATIGTPKPPRASESEGSN